VCAVPELDCSAGAFVLSKLSMIIVGAELSASGNRAQRSWPGKTSSENNRNVAKSKRNGAGGIFLEQDQ
jgi:hypothetical protein